VTRSPWNLTAYEFVLFPQERIVALKQAMRTSPALKSGLSDQGLTPRQAALIAGFAYLLSPVTTAEFSIMPKLVIPDNIEQTVQNLSAHHGLFVAAIFCYFITFLEDVVIAWALYVFLAPVNRSLSLLTAWFRLVYTTIVLVGWLNLVTVHRLLTTPDYVTLFLARVRYMRRFSFYYGRFATTGQ